MTEIHDICDKHGAYVGNCKSCEREQVTLGGIKFNPSEKELLRIADLIGEANTPTLGPEGFKVSETEERSVQRYRSAEKLDEYQAKYGLTMTQLREIAQLVADCGYRE